MGNKMIIDQLREDYPSASAIGRFNQCLASYQMGVLAREYDHLPEEDDEWALDGQFIHEALRKNDSADLQNDNQRNIYSKLIHRLNKYLTHWGASNGDDVIKETRLWMHDDEGLFPIFSGMADYTRIRGEEGLIIDFKTGWDKPPPPEANHQLKSLAVLRKIASPELQRITLQIISPHYDYTAYVMGIDELVKYEQALRGLIEQLHKAQAPVPGSYCKHCKGFLICPEVRKNLSLIKLEKNVDFPMTLPVGSQGARILSELKILEKFLKKCYAHYKVVLFRDPDAIPGWSLAPGDRVRIFKPARQVWGKLHELIGDKVFDAVTISVSKVDEFLEEGQSIPEELLTYRQNEASIAKTKERKTAP
jgi:hypothetical protein